MIRSLRYAAIAAVAFTRTASAQDFPASWTTPVPPVAIAEDVYYVGTEGLAAYLFVSPKGHILIDAPMEGHGVGLLEGIRGLGFDPADIKLIVTSHAHFDHVGGVAEVKRLTGARVLASPLDAALLESGGADITGGPFPAVAVDGLLRDGVPVRLGPISITPRFTPGHTPGCTSWTGVLSIESRPRPFLLVCSLSILPGIELVTRDGELGRQFCASAAALRGYPMEVFLAGHGSFMALPRKLAAAMAGDRAAFIDPEQGVRYLAREQGRIDSTLVAQGVPAGCAAWGEDSIR